VETPRYGYSEADTTYCSLPGAIGMYALSLGVQRIDEILPAPVYALLSGLNASTVGVIALAAVKLAEGAIKDRLTRCLVILGACAGLCYNALWYFPTIMAISGIVAVVYDLWLSRQLQRIRVSLKRRRSAARAPQVISAGDVEMVSMQSKTDDAEGVQRRPAAGLREGTDSPVAQVDSEASVQPGIGSRKAHAVPLRVGIGILVGFFGRLHQLQLVKLS
jgi:hypothetical protein